MQQDVAAERERIPALDRYAVLKKLAVGGMAEIFIAQRDGADDICVVKLLHEHLTRDATVSSRFLREAQVASLLQHPNIAHLTDAKRDPSGRFLYLAMEFIAGQDVEQMMFKLMEQKKMLPPELSVTVTLDVLAGLHYAHDFHGPDGSHLAIVHRDLSPRNVMVTYDGQVKIIDFGLARTNLGEFRTTPGMVMGTLRYMSPEQAVADPVDRRSDIYSWAVVLYEMLSGRPLITGHGTAQEILHAVVTQVPPPLSTLNPSLPKALDGVLERGLAKDRRDRWDTADDFRSALIDAAGPHLAALDEDRHALIGRFVSDLFRDEHAKTSSLLDEARRSRAALVQGHAPDQTRYGAPGEATRYGAPGVEVTRYGAPGEVTRAGVPTDPTRYGLPDSGAVPGPGEVTRAGLPGELTRAGLPGELTRAAVPGDLTRTVAPRGIAAEPPRAKASRSMTARLDGPPPQILPLPSPSQTAPFPSSSGVLRPELSPSPLRAEAPKRRMSPSLIAASLAAVAGAAFLAIVLTIGPQEEVIPIAAPVAPENPQVTASPLARAQAKATEQTVEAVRAETARASVARSEAEERAKAAKALPAKTKPVTTARDEAPATTQAPREAAPSSEPKRHYGRIWKLLADAERESTSSTQESFLPKQATDAEDELHKEVQALPKVEARGQIDSCIQRAQWLTPTERIAHLKVCLARLEKARGS
ncbi:protein kinase [Myxococcota bacterium]|nr:protein kinase [Myxococcota bacterium]